MFRFTLTCFILSTCLHLKAQQIDTISFVLTSFNNIYIPALLNQKDSLKMMFHTGESGVSIIEEVFNKIAIKKNATSTEANSWGGKGTAKFFKNNTFSIGNHRFDSLVVWVDKHSGQLTDGKFGPLLFKGKMIEINYHDKNFVIYESVPPKQHLKQFQKFRLTQEKGLLFIEGKLNIGRQRLQQKFMIHTGYGGTILLDDAFAQKHQLGRLLKITNESTLKDAYGNTLTTKKAVLPSFKIGRTKFKALPISFFEGSIGRQKISVLGNGLLKHYNMILDIENSLVYLKPNHLFEQ
ncbi:aspartyl protease family protein [Aureispira sp. CCB-E]|uniref:aspartyl protease family protein n=1 Tax=Aureispira sp. CCB-E TaxID=3051121 RepID=UPI0028685B54|nr:aspartyl protease family protein [Aureispira sp. CCB-E]WMX13301.1 aspartyl protease family protein [Aureispira sp. CCB-E]